MVKFGSSKTFPLRSRCCPVFLLSSAGGAIVVVWEVTAMLIELGRQDEWEEGGGREFLGVRRSEIEAAVFLFTYTVLPYLGF